MNVSATYLEDRHIYVFDEDIDPTEIILERFHEERDNTIRAEITVSTNLAPAGIILGPQRLNLLSERSVTMMAKTLSARHEVPPWDKYLAHVCRESVRRWREGEPLRLLDLDVPTDRRWLLEPYLEADGLTVLFAEGGSGKGWLSLAIALTVGTGQPILGREPRQMGTVAYLDWEASYEDTSAKLARLARPFGITDHNILYSREFLSLDSSAQTIALKLKECGCVMCVVDSKGMAANGAPESAETTLGLMRAIRRLGVPVLVVDHISKAQAMKSQGKEMAFGSIYTTNAARLAWSVKATELDGELRMRLVNTKANNGPRAATHGIILTFGETDARITLGEPPQLRIDEGTIHDRLVAILEEEGTMSLAQLCDLAGCSRDTARRTLNRHKDLFARIGEYDLWTLTPEAREGAPF